MSTTLLDGTPATIRAMATTLQSTVVGLEGAGVGLQAMAASVTTRWTGSAAEEAVVGLGERATDVKVNVPDLEEAATLLTTHGNELEDLQTAYKQVLAELEQAEQAYAAQGSLDEAAKRGMSLLQQGLGGLAGLAGKVLDNDELKEAADDLRKSAAELERRREVVDALDAQRRRLEEDYDALVERTRSGLIGLDLVVASRIRNLDDPDLDGYGDYEDRSEDPLWGTDNMISPSDIDQGSNLGDCWLLAVLAASAETDPDRIRSLITDNGDGTYTVHFADGDVTVDGQVSTESSESDLWVAIIEKAYAEYAGGGYGDIDSDKATRAYEDLFGSGSRTFDPDSTNWFGNVSPEDALDEMREALEDGRPVTCSVRGQIGINGGHALSVVDVSGSTVTVRNPWANNESIRDQVEAAGGVILSDGRIEFSQDEFADIFYEVQIAED